MGKVRFICQIPKSHFEEPETKAGYNQLRFSVSAVLGESFSEDPTLGNCGC